MKTTRTKNSCKKKAPKPSEPAVRDYVRICNCGTRVLVTTKKHGYLKSLTVELNGYLLRVDRTKSLNSAMLQNLSIPFEDHKDYKKLLRTEMIKKFSRAEVKKMVASEILIPCLIVRTFNPKQVKLIYCENCHSRMFFRLFKEIKHN